MHTITGDEPHYLVIAEGLLPTFELEQTGPYTREFQNRTIVENGLASPSATPTPENTHTVEGPRGLFNIHNIGLPILLAIPFLVGGEVASRLTMIAIGGAIIVLLLKLVSLTALQPRVRALIVLPWAIAMPLVPASTQIYPDLPAGALVLLGVYCLWRSNLGLAAWKRWLAVIIVSYLPWLHIRYGLPMVVVLLGMTWHWRNYMQSRVKYLVAMWLPAVISVGLLAVYNIYAFSNPTGPYESGDVMLNSIAVMQFLGLLFDQNQGMFIQQPLHFVGLFFFAFLLRKNPIATGATFLMMLGTLGPNSTHWNLYGGWSFSGRFGWTAGVLFTSLTVLAIAELWNSHRRAAKAFLIVGLLFQFRLMWGIYIQKLDLFPRIFNGWMGTYATFWPAYETSLPHWRDFRWAFSFTPNYVWLAIAAGVFVIGAMRSLSTQQVRTLLISLSTIGVVILAAHGRFGDLPYPEQRWFASGLPGKVGQDDGFTRIATTEDGEGLLTYGPYWETPAGSYEVGIKYKATSLDVSNAIIDVYFPESGQVIEQIQLDATANEFQEEFFLFTVGKSLAGKVELRTLYQGEGELVVEWIQMRRIGDNIRE